jgi:NADH:ubiquinone oxidoreductase subunit K
LDGIMFIFIGLGLLAVESALGLAIYILVINNYKK